MLAKYDFLNRWRGLDPDPPLFGPGQPLPDDDAGGLVRGYLLLGGEGFDLGNLVGM